MTPLTSPTEIKAHLLALLAEVLGTWRDGTPAIWIGEPPATLAPAKGVQCIISPAPSGPIHNTSGRQRFLDQSYQCRLVNVQPRDSQVSLGTAANWLLRSAHVQGLVYLPAGDTTAEQITFSIYAPGFVGRIG